MKCDATLLFGYSRKSKKQVSKLICFIPKHNVENHLPILLEMFGKTHVIDTVVDECGGKIESDISAINVPDYGGTYAELDVTFRCKRCGNTDYPNLPNQYSLSEFLTNVVENL